MAKLLIFETRRLVLPLETVVDALLELDRERGGRLALSSITDAHIEAGENPGLLLEALHADALAPEQRRYSLPAIAAATDWEILRLARTSVTWPTWPAVLSGSASSIRRDAALMR